MRVLIVKLSSFGDVIHTFPAVTDLAAAAYHSAAAYTDTDARLPKL